MALEGQIINDRRFIKVDVTADTLPGVIAQVPDTRAGIHNGATMKKSGDKATFDTECVAYVKKASATVFTAGAAVGWDNTGKNAVTTAGDFSLGKAAAAAGAGLTTVLVTFNV